MEPLVAVTIPMLGDARLKNWAKVVERVDESKASGWAYEGSFIATGGVQDVPVGSVILLYGEKGSRGNPQSRAEVLTANADGTLSRRASASGQAWARTLRDEVAELLADNDPLTLLQWSPELMRYEDEALLSELRRRGVEGEEKA
ncbi:MAG: hypothetical protein WAM81_08800 [Acidimicrobiia bacterium]